MYLLWHDLFGFVVSQVVVSLQTMVVCSLSSVWWSAANGFWHLVCKSQLRTSILREEKCSKGFPLEILRQSAHHHHHHHHHHFLKKSERLYLQVKRGHPLPLQTQWLASAWAGPGWSPPKHSPSPGFEIWIHLYKNLLVFIDIYWYLLDL